MKFEYIKNLEPYGLNKKEKAAFFEKEIMPRINAKGLNKNDNMNIPTNPKITLSIP